MFTEGFQGNLVGFLSNLGLYCYHYCWCYCSCSWLYVQMSKKAWKVEYSKKKMRAVFTFLEIVIGIRRFNKKGWSSTKIKKKKLVDFNAIFTLKKFLIDTQFIKTLCKIQLRVERCKYLKYFVSKLSSKLGFIFNFLYFWPYSSTWKFLYKKKYKNFLNKQLNVVKIVKLKTIPLKWFFYS